jgi:hypothetical protein
MLASVDESLIHALHLDAPWRFSDIGCGCTMLEILRRVPARGGSRLGPFFGPD